ncbi:MAG: hypothetical protein WBD73_03805 [Candidatus Acidiferrales bacterium]
MLHQLQALEAYLAQNQTIVVAAAAALLVIIFAIWVSGSRKRYVVLRQSAETETLAYQLGRIASALERLASSEDPAMALTAGRAIAPREAASRAARAEAAPQAGVGSMFGFGRRVNMPNPLYRAK